MTVMLLVCSKGEGGGGGVCLLQLRRLHCPVRHLLHHDCPAALKPRSRPNDPPSKYNGHSHCNNHIAHSNLMFVMNILSSAISGSARVAQELV